MMTELSVYAKYLRKGRLNWAGRPNLHKWMGGFCHGAASHNHIFRQKCYLEVAL